MPDEETENRNGSHLTDRFSSRELLVRVPKRTRQRRCYAVDFLEFDSDASDSET